MTWQPEPKDAPRPLTDNRTRAEDVVLTTGSREWPAHHLRRTSLFG